MDNPFDSQKLGQQAFLDFASLRKKKSEDDTRSSASLVEGEVAVVNQATSKEDINAQIMSARVYANKEIKQFKEAVNEFADAIDSLCMFKGLGEVLKGLCVHEVLENGVEPVLKGRKPPYMPDSAFMDMRKDLYKKLISRYIVNQEENK
jgi:hypothetical protein